MSRQHISPFLLALFLLVLTALPVGAEGGTRRAALVVRYPNGDVQTRCVAFNEASITGEELLQRSGLAVIMNYNAGLGGAVCSINGQGCGYPREDCFCHCQGVQCEYWAYYHWTGGGWQYSSIGASGYQVSDGALEGWSWGPGNFSVGTIPPAVSFGDICPAPTATPTTTPTRTATSTRTVTPTPTPTALPTGGGVATAAPQLSVETTANTVAPGACAVLKWLTWDAERVTLDGASVLAQDRLEVCPKTTQRYTVVASNAVGQTTRVITIAVTGVDQPQPTATATPRPTAAAVGGPLTTQSATNPTPPAPTLSPSPSPAPELAQSGLGLVPVAHAQAAPADPSRPVTSTEGVSALDPQITNRKSQIANHVTPTPLSRRPIDPAQATSTPILLARVAGSNAAGPAAAAQAGPANQPPALPLPDRSFSSALLPGYGAYLLTAGLLLAVGASITRRRSMHGA